jgi:hypothetical protein
MPNRLARRPTLQIGVGYSMARPDYVPQTFQGYTAYADFDFRPHLGARPSSTRSTAPNGITELPANYEIGGRYLRTYGPLVPYVKLP